MQARTLRGLPPNLDPFAIATALWRRREVIGQLARREVDLQYRGSVLGVLWALIQPLVLLAVYALVFLGVLPRSAAADAHPEQFVLGMFCALLLYTFFAESIIRAPSLVVGNPGYVKRVVFPLEVLPISVMGASLLNLVAGIAMLIAGDLLFLGHVPVTALLLPLTLLPLVLLTLGISWFLASLGVFLRDAAQAVRALTVVLMFLTPIFWTLEDAPDRYLPWLRLNPLTTIVDDTQSLLVRGTPPDPLALAGVTLASLAIFVAGHVWFERTRKGFADVL